MLVTKIHSVCFQWIFIYWSRMKNSLQNVFHETSPPKLETLNTYVMMFSQNRVRFCEKFLAFAGQKQFVFGTAIHSTSVMGPDWLAVGGLLGCCFSQATSVLQVPSPLLAPAAAGNSSLPVQERDNSSLHAPEHSKYEQLRQ